MCFVNKHNIERNKANVEGTQFENLCLMFVCVYVLLFCLCMDRSCRLDSSKESYEKSFEMCICL